MKVEILKHSLLLTLLAIAILRSGSSHASPPQLTLRVGATPTAGFVADGTVLAQGTITSDEPHAGFRVWQEVKQNGSPQRYTLTGKNGEHHRLNVRLAGEGWQPDMLTGQGMVRQDSSYSVSFRVEVDGNQTVVVDTWLFQMQAQIISASDGIEATDAHREPGGERGSAPSLSGR